MGVVQPTPLPSPPSPPPAASAPTAGRGGTALLGPLAAPTGDGLGREGGREAGASRQVKEGAGAGRGDRCGAVGCGAGMSGRRGSCRPRS